MSNKVYDVLKFFCLTIAPALIVFVNAVLPTLNVDADTINTISTIVSALATFIGTILGISSTSYSKTQTSNISLSTASSDEDVIKHIDNIIIENTTKVEFNGEYYELTGKENQILASYLHSEEEFDYVTYLYGDGHTATMTSKAYKTDEERMARYEKLTSEYPSRYPKASEHTYDTDLTLAENFSIAKGQKTKEQILGEL